MLKSLGSKNGSMNIFVLTGAGISAESGLATFRGVDGYWNGHRIENVCKPDAFERNPDAVCAFYATDRRKLSERNPTPHTMPWPNLNGIEKECAKATS
jgi:NAD-dependent SIR2 family protein deacetylase